METQAPDHHKMNRIPNNACESSVILQLVSQTEAVRAEFSVPATAFRDFLSWHLRRSGTVPAPPTSAEQRDLVLACACSLDIPKALNTFEFDCGPEFESAAKKLRLSRDQQADARQRLWLRLFVSEDNPPRILEYSGQGRLRHWFRILAVRFLLNELRSEGRARKRHTFNPDDLSLTTERDPELALLKLNCQQHFRAAFELAVGELSPEQRNSLRCHYVQSMTIDAMAAIFGIHRATAARRVIQARAALLERTRTNLRQKLGTNTEELDSLIRLAQTQSSLSVARLLGQEQ